jgi:hypothetical protein
VSRPDFDVEGTFRAVVGALDESRVPHAFIGAVHAEPFDAVPLELEHWWLENADPEGR